MYSFLNLEPVCCSMSSSNCCFLTCIQISQEAGQVVWYSHLLENFPQFIVIHTVKGFGIVNKAEIMFFWNSLAFSMKQRMLAIWSLVPLPFLKPAWTSDSSQFTYCWIVAWRILSITLLACEMSAIVQYKQGEKTAFRMGENNSKWSNWQTTNLKNIQATPTAQLQTNKWPNQKMDKRTK